MFRLPNLVSKSQWQESKHPRGQPENPGQFGHTTSTPKVAVGWRPAFVRRLRRLQAQASERGARLRTSAREKPAHDWTDYRPPGKYTGETDDEFSQWQATTKQHNEKVGATVSHWIESGLEWDAPAAARDAYSASLKRVFTNIGHEMTTAAMKNIRRVRFHESPQVMTRLFAGGGEIKVGELVGGVWIGDSRGDQGELNIDAGFKSGPLMPELHAHEIGHAVDGAQETYTRKMEWRSAWKEEIDRDDSPLSEYARTNPAEGFAEYVRLIATKGRDFLDFPKCHQFLKSNGLL